MLASLQRCRRCVNATFLSDLATMDGHHIDRQFLLAPTDRNPSLTKYNFVPEWPMSVCWEAWRLFWHQLYGPHLHLHQPLGPVINTPATSLTNGAWISTLGGSITHGHGASAIRCIGDVKMVWSEEGTVSMHCLPPPLRWRQHNQQMLFCCRPPVMGCSNCQRGQLDVGEGRE